MTIPCRGAKCEDWSEAFWVVWCRHRGPPSYLHRSFESAKQEAKRLASANKGMRFDVLEFRGFAYVPTDEHWTDVDEEIPF